MFTTSLKYHITDKANPDTSYLLQTKHFCSIPNMPSVK